MRSPGIEDVKTVNAWKLLRQLVPARPATKDDVEAVRAGIARFLGVETVDCVTCIRCKKPLLSFTGPIENFVCKECTQ